MLEFIGVAIFYLGVASAAAWRSWKHPVGVVGLTLILCSLITTASAYGTSFSSRVTIECVQAGLTISAARIAFAAAPRPAALVIVMLAVFDLAFCLAISFGALTGGLLVDQFGAITNAIFLLQCAAVATPGMFDAAVVPHHDSVSNRDLGGAGHSLDALCDRIK